jgi:hypothetical protein
MSSRRMRIRFGSRRGPAKEQRGGRPARDVFLLPRAAELLRSWRTAMPRAMRKSTAGLVFRNQHGDRRSKGEPSWWAYMEEACERPDPLSVAQPSTHVRVVAPGGMVGEGLAHRGGEGISRTFGHQGDAAIRAAGRVSAEGSGRGDDGSAGRGRGEEGAIGGSRLFSIHGTCRGSRRDAGK